MKCLDDCEARTVSRARARSTAREAAVLREPYVLLKREDRRSNFTGSELYETRVARRDDASTAFGVSVTKAMSRPARFLYRSKLARSQMRKIERPYVRRIKKKKEFHSFGIVYARFLFFHLTCFVL